MIFTLGINHHSAPLAIRERVAFGADKLGHALSDLTRERPDPQTAAVHARAHAIYRGLYPALSDSFAALNDALFDR